MNESRAEKDELLPDALVTAEILNLRSELGRARRSLRQREEALALLNRRLLALEDGSEEHVSTTGLLAEERARATTLSEQLQQATARQTELAVEVEHLRWADEEVRRLQSTKLFRYTWPVRRVISAVRSK